EQSVPPTTAAGAMPVQAGAASSMTAQAKKDYVGEKIALDFFETDIKNVFRILMEVSGKNFAIDKNVGGKVTLTFEKPVPWDQVLDLILKMNQLGSVTEGEIIRIATLETLKAEEDLRRLSFEAAMKAKEQQLELQPLITEYIPINYSNAKTDVLPHLEKISTKERGTISVDERTNLIIMTDIPDKIAQAKEIVNELDKVTPQVIIESRIVEANSNFSREIGTEWDLNVGPAFKDSLGGVYNYDTAMNFPITASTAGSGQIGFNFLRLAGTPIELNARLLAMDSQGDGKIISTPKIATLDNKKATIKQGLRYPYNKLDDSGNTVTEFQDIDLVLEVTPHVTPDGRISMYLKIVKNDLGNIINNQQSFTTKEAETELLVNDGDTVVIGGIIKTTKRTADTGFPFLKDIPIIGWLFKVDNQLDDKEELLIFITPRIVQFEQRRIQS
ncbi:MAG: type IV pilus secretin PilQ, partial [Desulfobacterales bacterium]|nr:type IV pilus secretin PilQ [Desulfobacterales bacterium]